MLAILSFLSFGWYCHDIGFHAGVVGMDVALITQEVDPVVIILSNQYAIENKFSLTIAAIEPDDDQYIAVDDIIHTGEI